MGERGGLGGGLGGEGREMGVPFCEADFLCQNLRCPRRHWTPTCNQVRECEDFWCPRRHARCRRLLCPSELDCVACPIDPSVCNHIHVPRAGDEDAHHVLLPGVFDEEIVLFLMRNLPPTLRSLQDVPVLVYANNSVTMLVTKSGELLEHLWNVMVARETTFHNRCLFLATKPPETLISDWMTSHDAHNEVSIAFETELERVRVTFFTVNRSKCEALWYLIHQWNTTTRGD